MEALLAHGQTCLQRRPRWVQQKIAPDQRGQKLPLRRPKTGRRQQQQQLVVAAAAPRSGRRRVVVAAHGMPSKLKEKDGGGAPTVEKTVPATAYRDGWFDRLAIRHLTQSIQTTTGVRTRKEGYEGLIEAASMVARHFDHKGQRELVIQSLNMAFPSPLMALIRTLLLPSKFTREYFAFFTTLFFPWLIGPCEGKGKGVRFNGRLEKNVVFIKKCRFLEGTNCVGMCTNMCKIPSQDFIKNSLGIPLYMAPNFEDMSCEMFFGQSPPAAADDPALAQPCHHFSCKAKQEHGVDCSSI